jgi:hypothetical protein
MCPIENATPGIPVGGGGGHTAAIIESSLHRAGKRRGIYWDDLPNMYLTCECDNASQQKQTALAADWKGVALVEYPS